MLYGADDCDALEDQYCYVTLPALADERVQTSAAGQVVLKLKAASRDCTANLVISPLEFTQRLAVLIEPAATESANHCFGAVNLGCRISGLGRSRSVVAGRFRQAEREGQLLGDEPLTAAGVSRP